MDIKLINNMTVIANELDEIGMTKEAGLIDGMIKIAVDTTQVDKTNQESMGKLQEFIRSYGNMYTGDEKMKWNEIITRFDKQQLMEDSTMTPIIKEMLSSKVPMNILVGVEAGKVFLLNQIYESVKNRVVAKDMPAGGSEVEIAKTPSYTIPSHVLTTKETRDDWNKEPAKPADFYSKQNYQRPEETAAEATQSMAGDKIEKGVVKEIPAGGGKSTSYFDKPFEENIASGRRDDVKVINKMVADLNAWISSLSSNPDVEYAKKVAGPSKANITIPIASESDIPALISILKGRKQKYLERVAKLQG